MLIWVTRIKRLWWQLRADSFTLKNWSLNIREKKTTSDSTHVARLVCIIVEVMLSWLMELLVWQQPLNTNTYAHTHSKPSKQTAKTFHCNGVYCPLVRFRVYFLRGIMFYLANFTLFTVSCLPFAIMYALRQHSSRSYAVSLKMKNYLFPIRSAENNFLSLFV